MRKVVEGGVSLNFTRKLGFGSILGPLSPSFFSPLCERNS